ncbi:MAG TPA: DUF4301 family protein [Oligoflexia bacterium]|nr:DUF4301 family protein [Oligoflexia bacterium]HMP26972.1 DUF4301 family protein [Oligoflexia bacterium]
MKEELFTEKDRAIFQLAGIEPAEITEQLTKLRSKQNNVKVVKACRLNEGITLSVNSENLISIAEEYLKRKPRLINFVPASGAASRMFASLISAKNSFAFDSLNKAEEFALKCNATAKILGDLKIFFKSLEIAPFKNELYKLYKNNFSEDLSSLSLENFFKNERFKKIIELLTDENGLNYLNTPKGLLPFHLYPKANKARTAFEEHLRMGAQFIAGFGGVAAFHFTISDEHIQQFKEQSQHSLATVKEEFGVSLEISYSNQKRSTDTISIIAETGEILRDQAGAVILRQGGHGALLENLNLLDADKVYIRNIDNVAPQQVAEKTLKSRKILLGSLLEAKKIVFENAKLLDSNEIISPENLSLLRKNLEKTLNFQISENLWQTAEESQRRKLLLEKLNRPIRVCGVVKNQGQPGGAPYWVSESDGSMSVQLVEASEIDLNNPEQHKIFQSSSHFNPVDIICSLRNYKGEKFNLSLYIDKTRFFRSKKITSSGIEHFILEHPGLWNGSMSNWITLFVEIDGDTFWPCKTIFDLLDKRRIDYCRS